MLEWGRLCAVGDPACRDLWSPPIFHPTPQTLSLSEPLLGLQTVYMSWRALGAQTAMAQLLTQATLLVAIFLLAYLLLHRAAGLPVHAAALGAYVAAFVAVLLTLRWPGGGSAWGWLIEWLPGASAIRAIGRLGVVLLPIAGLAVGFAFAAIAHRRWSRGTVAPLALLVLLEPMRRHGVFRPGVQQRHVELLARAVSEGNCSSFFVSPWTSSRSPVLKTQLDAMYVALATGVPTLNGYSSYGPIGWDLTLARPDQPAERDAFVARACDWAEGHRLDAASLCWIRFDLDEPRPPRIERLALADACSDASTTPALTL